MSKRWEIIRDGESTNVFVIAPDERTALIKAVKLIHTIAEPDAYVWVEEAER